ncbi:acyltransferase [Bradyrhizobium iriomotense]|uniref:Acyltransferase n=1 Tax=Bradyrhizobium iriomotense TaxID=441950 RepID=A0ABQ6BCE1_9BRAD|nr:acyltransferase [Bradyrhizobium iriomotense]
MAVIYTHHLTEKYWLFGIYWGRLGVQCFFVLSGFLITSILIRESETASSFRPIYVSFISRRAFRLYPLLLVTLTVCAVLGINAVRDGFLWHVTYLTNLYVIKVDAWPGPVSPLWSLAVEEQFYLFWPFVIYFTPRRLLPALLIVFIAAAPAFRLIWRAEGLGDFGAWVLPPAYFDSLAMGALLALYKKRTEVLWLAGLAGTCIWLILALMPPDSQTFFAQAAPEDTAAAMIFAWVIARASTGFHGMAGNILNNSALQYIGAISYGIYVLHGFVPYYLETHGLTDFLPHWLSKLTSVGLTIILASISWHVLERPVTRLGQSALDRWKLRLRVEPGASPHGQV